MTCDEVISVLQKQAPESFAESWDNPGLLVGRRDKIVNKILIAIDATDEIIDRAVELSVDMLLTHHPLIFSPLKKINTDDFIGKRVIRLIQNDISCYAMHTNFDVLGMAQFSSDILGLTDTEVLEVTYEADGRVEGIGRVGYLQNVMSLRECCELVKKRFNIENVKVFGNPDCTIDRVAISPGSGKSMISHAISKGAGLLITGDIDHHDGIDAVANGLNIIDSGHYGIEKIFIPFMEKYLSKNTDLTVYLEEYNNPFYII